MKTTRKSFSRKSILVIVSVFLAISLTATGFAAWLISNDANKSTDGNVNISNVSDAILEVTVDKIDGTVNFAPKKEDGSGNIRFSEDDKDDSENLTIKVTGKIGKFKTLKNMLITLQCTDEILKAAGYEFDETKSSAERTYTYNAAKAFIKLPDYAVDMEGKALPSYTEKSFESSDTEVFTKVDDDNYTFSFNVEFKWGALFAGYNPGRFLDKEDRATDSIEEDSYTSQIANLLAIANEGKESSKYSAIDAFAKKDILDYMYNLVTDGTAKYTVVINAKAK